MRFERRQMFKRNSGLLNKHLNSCEIYSILSDNFNSPLGVL